MQYSTLEGIHVFKSDLGTIERSYGVRPVVYLTPKVDMVLEETEGDINYWTFE